MSTDDRAALRIAFLTSAIDCPMSVEELMAFTGWSETKLMRSTIPRGKDEGRVFFMKSQVTLWFTLRIDNRINPEQVEGVRRSA